MKKFVYSIIGFNKTSWSYKQWCLISLVPFLIFWGLAFLNFPNLTSGVFEKFKYFLNIQKTVDSSLFHNRKLKILCTFFGFYISLNKNIAFFSVNFWKNWQKKCIKIGARFLFFLMNWRMFLKLKHFTSNFLNIPEISPASVAYKKPFLITTDCV